MQTENMEAHPDLTARLARYPLLEALIERRSRRFGKGMRLNGGPLAYASPHTPQPLSLDEEAALSFARCGLTGYALAELSYDTGDEPEAGAGNIMMHFVGRTVASGEVTGWKDGAVVQAGIPRYSDNAIAATIACCDYLYQRYGRFPTGSGPFRTVLAHQAHHLDLDFYETFYRSEALSTTQRRHQPHGPADGES